MAIEIKHSVSNLSEMAFHDLDYKVMKRAFDLYNSTGNLWDECDYRDRLHDIPELITELMTEWSTFLDIQLYKEAILHFLAISPVQQCLRFCPIDKTTLIHFTTLNRKKAAYCKNLKKYLNATKYQRIEWVNFDQNQIELQSLSKKLFCH